MKKSEIKKLNKINGESDQRIIKAIYQKRSKRGLKK